eukprot:TRINITY_DN690_c0_g1_i3.p3 TRINITY_DN690_c0_g1~~TRINITY_DN690_c0_g1_i3.p3  ORF type:complete len:265 (+),score=48.64 TRINITY_DN690_c0_g1_i3:34-795(+)
MARELEIELGTLFAEETRRGAEAVHYVVKNTQFTATVTAEDMELLQKLRMNINLVYAPDKSKVEFEALKKEQVEWLSEVSDDSILLQIRVKILSSQVQNTLFRLHIEALDNAGEAIYSGYTEPIKVVSKPDQIRKKRAAVGEPEADIPTAKRRARGEEILEHIQHARDTQHKNLQIIEAMVQSTDAHALPVDGALASLVRAVEATAHSARSRVIQTALSNLPQDQRVCLTQYILPELQKMADAAEEEPSDDEN